ncbi:hypothetical protein [uncultured Williamsia sp.]|uniref:hypothetical protein n=1 Tax=uncultured Williamsia sp. TaxID=259311 RepID=UPI002608B270|nr:hypothetical protein [uncultured Williamsia sp.]
MRRWIARASAETSPGVVACGQARQNVTDEVGCGVAKPLHQLRREVRCRGDVGGGMQQPRRLVDRDTNGQR